MRILVAPNSFKECADAVTVASAIRDELDSGLPGALIEMLPVTDGGDGFLDVCKRTNELAMRYAKVPAIHNGVMVDVPYGIDKQGKTAFIESALVIGLAGTPVEFRKPLNLSSSGLSVLLHAIAQSESAMEKVIIGLGGTAINDLGLGCASIFGLRILDESGNDLPIVPANYTFASSIVLPTTRFPVELELVTDVQADLLGEFGTSRVFSPQKGATPEDVEKLETGFANILRILERDFNLNFDDKKMGAAGGIALGLSLFASIKLIPAKEFLFSSLKLREKIESSDVIITSEGSYDDQSALQKAPAIILDEAVKLGKKAILIAGKSSFLGKMKDLKSLL